MNFRAYRRPPDAGRYARPLHRRTLRVRGARTHRRLGRRLQRGPGASSPSWALIGALFDEAHGGFGGGGFDIAVVFEALGPRPGRRAVPGSAVLAGSAIAACRQRRAASADRAIDRRQHDRRFAHGEAETGYDADASRHPRAARGRRLGARRRQGGRRARRGRRPVRRLGAHLGRRSRRRHGRPLALPRARGLAGRHGPRLPGDRRRPASPT